MILFSIIKLSLSFLSTYSIEITAFFTAIMSMAIIVTAVTAFHTIRENRRIVKEKIDLQRKSLAKNLLLEIRDNNFALDMAENDLGKLSEEALKESFDKKLPKLVFIFIKKIVYQTFLNRYLDIDFKNGKIIPLLREYYSELEMLENSIKQYNDAFFKYNFEFIKIDRIISMGNIIRLKNKKLDKELLNILEIEADFILKENGLEMLFKPLDLSNLKEIMEVQKQL